MMERSQKPSSRRCGDSTGPPPRRRPLAAAAPPPLLVAAAVAVAVLAGAATLPRAAAVGDLIGYGFREGVRDAPLHAAMLAFEYTHAAAAAPHALAASCMHAARRSPPNQHLLLPSPAAPCRVSR